MRRGPIAAILVLATILGVQTPIWAQSTFNPGPLVPSSAVPTPTPLGWYGIGGIACAAVSPMVGTLVLGRE